MVEKIVTVAITAIIRMGTYSGTIGVAVGFGVVWLLFPLLVVACELDVAGFCVEDDSVVGELVGELFTVVPGCSVGC